MVTLISLSQNWLEQTWDYRPSAFWFWNAGMDLDEMAAVVRQMATSEIREFLVHPIHGLGIEYLSAEYFDRLRFALDLAREHQLKVWIYDEFGWPSGVAGGMVIRAHPEFRNQYLSFARSADGQVMVQPRVSTAVIDNVMGAPWTRSEAGYLDTLNPDAVRCFIELTHKRVYKECGGYFGDVITGFFTDEPSTMVDGQDGGPADWSMVGMPWTPALPALFRERFGYDIEPRYSELAEEGFSQVKRDYWSLVKDVYSESYHGQIARWCAAHGVKHTGHVGEDRLLMQLRFSGSIYRCLRHMDEPGIDYLGCGPDPEDRFIEQVAVRSIARHTGRDRVYCEAYGITPFDIRLGSMLRRAQMLGIHGINDIALMGFHQSLDGIRKHTYWPPIFRTAPWWPFFAEYRDAFTRSVGLVSLGKPRARYAVLYPQCELENVGVFYRAIWSGSDPAASAVTRLGRAVYAAGETFEFVFAEVLDQARVIDGRITLPSSSYDAVLAPSDLAWFDADKSTLDALEQDGGRVLRASVDEIEATILATPPEWADLVTVGADGEPGDVRVYDFAFPDGRLLALRNTTDFPRTVFVSAVTSGGGRPAVLSEWDPGSGDITSISGRTEFVAEPRTCWYFTITESAIGSSRSARVGSCVPLDAQWQVTTDCMNTARLSHIQFSHRELGWLDAVEPNVPGSPGARPRTRMPLEFEGLERIEFRAEFDVVDVPGSLGLVFEHGHVESLCVNGVPLDLMQATEVLAWDLSCRSVDATRAAKKGSNSVEGVITFESFETRMVNNGFFTFHPMPHLDVCLSGTFKLAGGKIIGDDGTEFGLPLNLSTAGWEQYSGIAHIHARVEVPEIIAARVRGVAVDLVAEDCLELLVDGVSLGRRVVRPYVFGVDVLTPGVHGVELRISSTSGNILDKPSPWGISSVDWVCV